MQKKSKSRKTLNSYRCMQNWAKTFSENFEQDQTSLFVNKTKKMK